VSVGPAWSLYAGRNNQSSHARSTLHGSVALSKEFRRGGVVLSFARSDSFSGIISDSFHNRYDVNLHREFTPRLHGSISGSYIQQQFSNARNTNGELVSGELRYFLNRNWATFAQARYLNVFGNERIMGAEKSVIVGLRWAWVPEKP
jgi:predicted porin